MEQQLRIGVTSGVTPTVAALLLAIAWLLARVAAAVALLLVEAVETAARDRISCWYYCLPQDPLRETKRGNSFHSKREDGYPKNQKLKKYFLKEPGTKTNWNFRDCILAIIHSGMYTSTHNKKKKDPLGVSTTGHAVSGNREKQ